MADNSRIEWCDATWNPVTGCTKVSPGCDHCYIDRTPPFRIAGRTFDGPGAGATTGVILHPERLDLPLRWRRPRRVFVNSLSDLFHNAVSDGYIARVWAIMALAPRHRFMVLTKRHGRMRSLLNSPDFRVAVHEAMSARVATDLPLRSWYESWPLPNVWIGVTVEDQQRADLRVPALLGTPAARRFLSCEPLLGPVDLDRSWLGAKIDQGPRDPRVDWVIAGGESGPDARPMHPDWARRLRDQCQDVGVPFHFKQWGEWAADSYAVGALPDRCTYVGEVIDADWNTHGLPFRQRMRRVGKKVAGRELDGRTWDEEPS